MRNDLMAAIDRLEENVEYLEEVIDDQTTRSMVRDEALKDIPAFAVALTALREKAERERGCAYCNESKHLYHEAGPTTRMDSYMCVCDDQLEVELWQSGNSGCLAKINFCPMCGNALPSKYKPEQPKIEWDAFIEAQIQKAVENHRNNNGEDDNHGA